MLLLGGALCVCGCPQGPEKVGSLPPRTVAEVDSILLQALPAAVNWDDRPGPDGLQVRVLFFRRGRALPVTVSGMLEFALYEGNVARDTPAAQPFHTWRFSDRQLTGYLTRAPAGWGYGMPLAWGSRAPGTGTVTLVGKYISPDGRALLSAPVAIAIEPK